MHQASHLALVLVQFFVIVIHGSLVHFRGRGGGSVQVVAELLDAVTTEYTEHLSLLMREFRRCLATEFGELVPQEFLHSGQTEVGESRTIVE